MAEAADRSHHLVKGVLPGVPERRMPQVVREGDGFGEVLVEPQRAGDGAGHLHYLQRVGQARPIVIPLRREEDLGLMLQPAEGLAVNDAITIALKTGAQVILRLSRLASFRGGRQGSARTEPLALPLFGDFSGGWHAKRKPSP